jgi:hypothetical protein
LGETPFFILNLFFFEKKNGTSTEQRDQTIYQPFVPTIQSKNDIKTPQGKK